VLPRAAWLVLLAVAACAWSVPSSAQRAPRRPPVTTATLDADLAAYGAWLGRVQQVEAPLQAELSGLSASWQEAVRGVGIAEAVARFRPVVARILATADRTDAALRAMDAPEFAGFPIAQDLRPPAILGKMIEINGNIRAAIDSFNPLLDAALHNDEAAVAAAAARMIAGFRLVLESQIVFARGTLAATEADSPAWEVGNIRLIYFRAAERIIRAYPERGETGRDPALPGDLSALARELEAAADRASRGIEGLLATLSRQLQQAERSRDAGYAGIIRRNIAIFTVDRDLVPLARELARILRVGAADIDGQAIAATDLVGLFRQLQPVRARLQALAQAENAALAGAR